MKFRLLGIRLARVLLIVVILWVVCAFVISVSDEPQHERVPGGARHRRPSASRGGIGSWKKPKQKSQAVASMKGQKHLSPENVTETSLYVEAVLEPTLTTFDGLNCSKPLHKRYTSLKGRSSWGIPKPKYFFALDLYQSREVIARLLASVLEAAKYLGTQHCAISIVEGRSTDGTFDILFAVQRAAINAGIDFYLTKNDDVDPKAPGVDRFDALAQLRNQALRPLLKDPSRYDADPTVIFSNDVSLCVNDILELVYQRKHQKADLACAMDYSNDGLFYDVWISRGMTGDIFFEIPSSGLWKYAKNLFWNDDKAKRRLLAKKPFQVYACWNGIAAFTAKPLLQEGVKFQASGEDECLMGEPTIFCRDFWNKGFGRIMVVPSVWVAYGNSAIEKIKRIEGYVEQHVLGESHVGPNEKELIEWEPKPPSQVKCLIPSMADPTWVNSTTFAMPPKPPEEFSEIDDNDQIPEDPYAPPTPSISVDNRSKSPVKVTSASSPRKTVRSNIRTSKPKNAKDLKTRSRD